MASCMHKLVINKTKSLVEGVKFISFSCDKMKTFYQQSWVSIHTYFVEDWQQTPLLLSLPWNGATFDNLKHMVFFHDLYQDKIASKLITFGAIGLSVF